MVVTRFAPTISGNLHIGSLYNAYLNWKFAKENGGKFYLRLDGQQLDRKGSRKGYADSIEEDLDYFGLKPDKVIRQYERKDLYRKEFIRRVIDAKRDDIYYCDCTPEKITDRVVNGSNLCGIIRTEKYDVDKIGSTKIGFVIKREYLYDNHCRELGKKLDLDNYRTVVRIKCSQAPMLDVAVFFDGQPDLSWTSAFDDMEMGITHRIRGLDIEPFCWLEREAARTLDYNTDTNTFHGIIYNGQGKKLSKWAKSPRASDLINSGVITKEKLFNWFDTLPGTRNTEPIKYMENWEVLV